MGVRSTNSTQSFFDDFFRSGTDAVSSAPPGAAPSGIIATGGVISDYEDSGTYYRSHIFTATGAFVVTSVAVGGAAPNNIAILAVGGGGGGGQHNAAGGGAGGLQYSASVPVSAFIFYCSWCWWCWK